MGSGRERRNVGSWKGGVRDIKLVTVSGGRGISYVET